MFKKMYVPLLTSGRWMAVLFSLALLSACANTWSAKVTTYQNWPTDAFNSPYFIQPAPENYNPLKYQAVADSVRVAMGAAGLVEGGAMSRLQVNIYYDSPLTQQRTERFVDPYFNGFYPNNFMWGGFGYGGGFSSGIFYSPPLVSVPINVYQNTLQIVIKDKAKDMSEIYNVTVIHQSESDNLIEVIPYLSRAAFSDFPGMNGKTQYIKIKRNP